MMRTHCENCGQPALETDKACWHCGRPLAGRDVEELDKVSVNKGWQQTQSLGAISGYVLVAGLVIVAAILVTNALGRQPRVSAEVGARPPEGWEAIQDFHARFTFYLPEEWSWFEQERREDRAAPPLAVLLENDIFYQSGTRPLGTETDDLAIDFLAMPISDTAAFENESAVTNAFVTADAFMIVAHSDRLNSTTYEETIQFLLNSEHLVFSPERITDMDRDYLDIFVETPVEPGFNFDYLQCVQQFFLGGETSILVALCGKNTTFDAYQRTIDEILTSFRRLS